MYRCLNILIICVIAGCAHFSSHTEEPLLPDTSNLPCCWQIFEQLEINYHGEQLTLLSVTAMNENKLTVVMLDSLGRRVFTIIQYGNKVKVEEVIQIQHDFPVKWMLIGVFLRNMPDSQWLFENSNWVVERNIDHVVLKQDDRIKLRLIESVERDVAADNSLSQDYITQLQYPDLKLEVNITTLSKQSL